MIMAEKFHEYAEVDSRIEAMELEAEGWRYVETKKNQRGQTVFILGRNPRPEDALRVQLARKPLHKTHTWLGIGMVVIGIVLLFFMGPTGFLGSGFEEILIGAGVFLLMLGVFEFRGK